MIDKTFLGYDSSLVFLEDARKIKEPFDHVRKATIYRKGSAKPLLWLKI